MLDYCYACYLMIWLNIIVKKLRIFLIKIQKRVANLKWRLLVIIKKSATSNIGNEMPYELYLLDLWRHCYFQSYWFCVSNLGYPILCHWSLSIPPQNIKKLWLSDVFRGYRKRPVAWNGLVELGLCTLTDSINCFLKYMTCLLFFGGFYSWNQEHKAFPNKFAPICKVYVMKMFNWRLEESTVMLS